jgi:hypothetical protein
MIGMASVLKLNLIVSQCKIKVYILVKHYFFQYWVPVLLRISTFKI